MPAVRRTIVMRLFELYYERVYCFARKTLDQQTAEDVAQEVFVRVMNLRDLEKKEISASYLVKIADNLIKRRHRRLKRLEAILAGSPRGEEWSPGAEGEAEREEGDAVHVSTETWEMLTPGERDAVRLVVCEGLSYEDAARALDVKVSTLNNWKFRGIQRLKSHCTAAGRDELAESNMVARGLRREREVQGGAA